MKLHTNLLPIIFFSLFTGSTIYSQDTLVFVSGEEILVKIKELTPTTIKYSKSDSADNTLVQVLRSDIHMIKYESGVTDVLHTAPRTTQTKNDLPDGRIVIPAFSSIYVENTYELRSRSMYLGQEVPLRVIRDFILEGQVIVPEGTIITGKVTHLKEPKFLGRPGELEISVYEVETLQGTTLPLNRHIYMMGKDKSTEVIILGAAVFWPILFIKGGEVVIEAYTPLRVETSSFVY